MPDSTEIDKALIARLRGGATLTGLLPDGVHWNEAPQGKTKFAIVSMVITLDRAQRAPPGPRRAGGGLLYLVKAVALGVSRARACQAAARIDALLEDQPLTITGYTCAALAREERIDDTEIDDLDASIRWQHRGGRYRLVAVPVAAPIPVWRFDPVTTMSDPGPAGVRFDTADPATVAAMAIATEPVGGGDASATIASLLPGDLVRLRNETNPAQQWADFVIVSPAALLGTWAQLGITLRKSQNAELAAGNL